NPAVRQIKPRELHSRRTRPSKKDGFAMQCPTCQGETRRFGRNRNGSQRFRCDACKATFTDETTRPRDNRRLADDKMILCLRMLLEGNSIRAVERITSVHRDTIIDAMVVLGAKCKRLLESRIHRIPVEN